MAARSKIKVNSLPRDRREKSSEHSLPIARGIAGDLRKWPIFHSLKLEFAKTIRLCCVFGSEGSEVLFLTQDDEVWGRGRNLNGILGTGNATPIPRLVKIPELCGKSIETFAFATKHALALTKKGEVFGWGTNECLQVCDAESKGIFAPTFVYNGEDPALEIACGNSHSVCRTRRGAVYCWGDPNATGMGKRRLPPAVRKVEGLIADLKCVGISCCSYSTVAVFENGEVYVWGKNDSGQLGIGSTINQLLPVKVELGRAAIRKVACGYDHTLALAVDGSLYVWGRNAEGQLGWGHKESQPRPLCHSNLKDSFGPIFEIAAKMNTSAVMTENSKVLIWGTCGWEPMFVAVPKEVPCESVQDFFAASTAVSVTPVPLIVTSHGGWTTDFATQESNSASGWNGNLVNTVAEHFNNPLHADVKFIVANETIHAHRTVLKFQSEYFRTMFEGAWKDSGDTIEIPEFSYTVYKAFLRYFYTGELNLSATEALELLDLAKECSENALKMKCQRRVESLVAVENCASIYASAVRCGAEELQKFCFRFAMDNLTAVSQTAAFAELPDNIVKGFFVEVAKQGAFKN